MKTFSRVAIVAMALLWADASFTQAEMLAMVIYETKAEESIRELRVEKTEKVREDGLAIIDVDPASDAYGKILAKFPLPEGLAPHHQYYNPDKTKIYVTATLLPMLHVVDLTRAPYRISRIDTPGCQNLDQVVFSSDNKTWWVTCNETAKILVGDAITDQPVGEILISGSGPHGIALHEGIDRLIVASLGSIENFDDKIIVIEASTGTVLSRHKVSNRPSPAHAGPVGIHFIRDADPPFAYVNIDAGGRDRKGTLWVAIWNPDNKDFEVREVFDFGPTSGSFPVAMGFDRKQERMFVSTARPGLFHVFDISGDPLKPKLLKTLPASQGAHHAAFSPDERYAFVQNGVLNLPGFSDGSITVIDLEKLETIDTITIFKDAGYTTNHILMLPEWYRAPGE